MCAFCGGGGLCGGFFVVVFLLLFWGGVVCLFVCLFVFALACERIFIKTHSIKVEVL